MANAGAHEIGGIFPNDQLDPPNAPNGAEINPGSMRPCKKKVALAPAGAKTFLMIQRLVGHFKPRPAQEGQFNHNSV